MEPMLLRLSERHGIVLVWIRGGVMIRAYAHAPSSLLIALLLTVFGGRGWAGDFPDQRVVFDPTTLGPAIETLASSRRPVTPTQVAPPPHPVIAGPKKAAKAPAGHVSGATSHPPHGFSPALAKRTDDKAVSSFDGLKIGNFSIGVETETNYKRR